MLLVVILDLFAQRRITEQTYYCHIGSSLCSCVFLTRLALIWALYSAFQAKWMAAFPPFQHYRVVNWAAWQLCKYMSFTGAKQKVIWKQANSFKRLGLGLNLETYPPLWNHHIFPSAEEKETSWRRCECVVCVTKNTHTHTHLVLKILEVFLTLTKIYF